MASHLEVILCPPTRTHILLAVVYQPNGGRSEVKQRMYLRFREGAVYGIGFEDDRKLCKVGAVLVYVLVW